MKYIVDFLSDYDSILNLISCIFTVAALIFALYCFLLEQLGADESDFLRSKDEKVKVLSECLDKIKTQTDIFYQTYDKKNNKVLDNSTTVKTVKIVLESIKEVNNQLEIIMSYRFWVRSKVKKEYGIINVFHNDSKYLISTMERYLEAKKGKAVSGSLIEISTLEPRDIEDIYSDYGRGLEYILDFIKNWN